MFKHEICYGAWSKTGSFLIITAKKETTHKNTKIWATILKVFKITARQHIMALEVCRSPVPTTCKHGAFRPLDTLKNGISLRVEKKNGLFTIPSSTRHSMKIPQYLLLVGFKTRSSLVTQLLWLDYYHTMNPSNKLSHNRLVLELLVVEPDHNMLSSWQ